MTELEAALWAKAEWLMLVLKHLNMLYVKLQQDAGLRARDLSLAAKRAAAEDWKLLERTEPGWWQEVIEEAESKVCGGGINNCR